MKVVVTDFDLHDADADYESLVAAGQAVTDAHDRNRWAIGDLAMRVEKRYGDGMLEDYASKLKLFPRVLRLYRQIADFYPAENGIRELFPALSWSHYRMCVRLKDLDSACAMLAQASDNNWSARDLTDAINVAIGKPPPRRPVLEVTAIASERGVCVDDALLVPGVAYQVRIYSHE